MGSSSKNGGGTQHVNATIAGLVCWGPVYGLRRILLNGEIVWEGPLLREASTNPVNLSTQYGTIRFYWGTENQSADATLNQYEEHPPYKGLSYFVMLDFDHGQSTNAYNVEFILMAAPDQDIVTDDPAAEDLDDAVTVNPIVLAAEILRSPAWLGLDDSLIDDASFQSVAEDVHSEVPDGAPADRCAAALTQLVNDANEVRKVISEILAPADAWLRIDEDGKIECGRWRRDGDPPSVTTLTFDDLSDWPEIEPMDPDSRPNSCAVEFTDSEALHKEAKITVDDLAGIVEADGRLRRHTLRAPFLVTYDMALRAGQEANRRTLQVGSWSGNVRASRAVTPGGAMLLPGDYVIVPVSAPGETLVTRLLRITRVVRPKNATKPVQISGTFDPAVAPVLTIVEAPEVVEQPGTVMPPVVYRRVLALPAETPGDTPPIHVLAARPHNLAIGMDVYYDDDTSGDFPPVGKQRAFALPVSLVASKNSAATTIRVALLAEDADGVDAQRDRALLTDWSGGETEGRNDELLLILLRKTAGVIDYQAGDLLEWVEVMSISGAATLITGDTYDVPVLRGRLGTTALDFTDGSFPDVWSHYEGWIIPRAQLESLFHADFDSMLVSGDPGYFRLGAYASRAVYDPDDADAERQRREDASLDELEYASQPDDTTWFPEDEYSIPPGLNTAPQIDFTTPGSFPADADETTGELAVDVDFTDATSDLVRVQLYSQQADGSDFQSHLDASFSPRASYNFADTLVFPNAATYTLSAVATDASGLTRRLDVTVTRPAP